jgi:hypothetical protein
MSSLQPPTFTVLPPSSNHFQPIHSRTPSVEIRDVLKPADLNTSSASKFSPNMFNQQPKNASNFFDQLNTEKASNPSPSNEANKLTQPPIITPLPIKPNYQASPETLLQNCQPAVKIQTQLSSQIPSLSTSILPPPSSIPPPMSIQPPPANSTKPASGSANPYSARGALNKKVYDTGIPVAPVAQNPTFLKPLDNNDAQMANNLPPTTGSLYIPTPTSANVPLSFPTTPLNTPQTPLANPLANPTSQISQFAPSTTTPAKPPLEQQQNQPLNQFSIPPSSMTNSYNASFPVVHSSASIDGLQSLNIS